MPQDSGAKVVRVLTLAALGVLVVVVWRRRAKQRTPVTAQEPLVVSRPERVASRPQDRPLKLADAAVLYERAVIELGDLPEDTKLRALRLVAHVIVPLVGALTVEDLPAVVAGVRQVRFDENEHDAGVLIVWNDFARWSQSHLLPFRLL